MNLHLSFSKHCWQYSILVALHEKPEAVVQGCSVKKVFLKISQTKGVFLEILGNFQEHLFHRTPSVAACEKLKAEAVVRRYSVKKVFFEILLNWQENTCAEVSFLEP